MAKFRKATDEESSRFFQAVSARNIAKLQELFAMKDVTWGEQMSRLPLQAQNWVSKNCQKLPLQKKRRPL